MLNYLYHLVNARGEALEYYETFEEAQTAANEKGLAIACQNDDGSLYLRGHDPLVSQVLGRVHVMESYRTALRRVISLWGGEEGKDYREYESRRAPCPGWSSYRALDRASRRVLMTWVAWIHRQHRKTFTTVMCGRL